MISHYPLATLLPWPAGPHHHCPDLDCTLLLEGEGGVALQRYQPRFPESSPYHWVSTRQNVCWDCFFVFVLFLGSTGASSLVKQSGRCRPLTEWPSCASVLINPRMGSEKERVKRCAARSRVAVFLSPPRSVCWMCAVIVRNGGECDKKWELRRVLMHVILCVRERQKGIWLQLKSKAQQKKGTQQFWPGWWSYCMNS